MVENKEHLLGGLFLFSLSWLALTVVNLILLSKIKDQNPVAITYSFLVASITYPLTDSLLGKNRIVQVKYLSSEILGMKNIWDF